VGAEQRREERCYGLVAVQERVQGVEDDERFCGAGDVRC